MTIKDAIWSKKMIDKIFNDKHQTDYKIYEVETTEENNYEEPEFTITNVETNMNRKIFYARKNVFSKWKGFETTSDEEYEYWEKTHKGWKKYNIMKKPGKVSWPNVKIEKVSIRS